MDASKSAAILGIPPLLLKLTWKLLVAVNQVHSFPDEDNYCRIACKAHRLYLKTFGRARPMSAILHILYAHGSLYLNWAKDTVGVPLGAISDNAMECENKMKKFNKKSHARMNSVVNNHDDAFHACQWRSDPLVRSFWEISQKIKRGHRRK